MSKKSSSAGPVRRLPPPSFGFDINFCRNPACGQFAIPPDPYDGRGRSRSVRDHNFARGKVGGKGDETSFQCGACRTNSVVKNNRAIVEEYRRLRRIRRFQNTVGSCQDPSCNAHGRPVHKHPELYRRHGQTAGGDRRWMCKTCGKTFSIGSPTRRQTKSDKNGLVLRLLTNDTSLSKICEITGLSPRGVYSKIDFIHRQVRAFTSRREGCFEKVDWVRVGRRFATDSQSLVLNWPNKRTRALVEVQHLCTAHANSGYIVAAHLGFDPEVEMPEIEALMHAANDFALPRAFRRQARVWSESEFADYLDKRTRSIVLSPHESEDFDDELQLPHIGAKIRKDIAEYAHALLLRRFLHRIDHRFVFVLDADPGLARAFVAVFSREVRRGMVDVIVAKFAKNLSNDERNSRVTDGYAAIEQDTGITPEQFKAIPTEFANEIIDYEIIAQIQGAPSGCPFNWPYHTKPEPDRTLRILTDRGQIPVDRQARLMRLATLRSVDAYFHKVRSNIRATARPGHTPSSNHQAWTKHYYYNPKMLSKVIEIYRFKHNWMGSRHTIETPAMKLGIAAGKIYERDLFGQ